MNIILRRKDDPRQICENGLKSILKPNMFVGNDASKMVIPYNSRKGTEMSHLSVVWRRPWRSLLTL